MVSLVLTACTGGGPDPARSFDELDRALPDSTVEQLQGVLEEAVRQSGSSGGLAGVWAPWSGTWEGVTGTTGFEDHAPKVTPQTKFRLTTGTTEITCTVLLRLADAGVVGLDDHVSSYVDDTPGIDGITLRQLCQQTSGLGDFYPTLRGHFAANPQRVWSETELISGGLAAGRQSAPGEGWAPSQAGVMLLAQALRNATGRDWNSLADDYVFGPLGMDDTALPAPSEVDHHGVLGGYVAKPGADGAPDCTARFDDSKQSSSMGGAAAGAITTLADAQALSEAFATGALLGEQTSREQWTLVPMSGDAPAWQGYGVGGAQYGPMRGTAGEGAGALTAAFTDPKSGLTVVVALNDSTAGADFVRETAFALASIASKATAAPEHERPMVELPWSLDQSVAKMAELAKCPIAEAPPAE
ncbi:serine hydrolase domain-containing protein [Agromyces mediolanus]|uniref:serine hydrolase domain-containing protein n=1 Tax=Agromyces mediolanus TaxID=41986 RepID=UPI003833B49F